MIYHQIKTQITISSLIKDWPPKNEILINLCCAQIMNPGETKGTREVKTAIARFIVSVIHTSSELISTLDTARQGARVTLWS